MRGSCQSALQSVRHAVSPVLHLLRATFTPFTAAAPPPSKLLITPSIYEFSFHAPTDLRSSRAVPQFCEEE